MIDGEPNQRAQDALEQLLLPIGVSAPGADVSAMIAGEDPVLPGATRVGEAFGVAAMAAAVGAAVIWHQRTGEGQDLRLDVREAAHGINPDLTFGPTVNGHRYPNWVGNFHPFGVVPFETRDGRWVYPSGVYPAQQIAWGRFFDCGLSFERIGQEIARWDSLELEDAANAAGHTLCIARSADEWASHPQGQYLGSEPVIAVRKIADSAPEPLRRAARPLAGITVLSLTHAVAGPTAGRTLAEQGANVLCVNNEGFEHDWVYDDANVGQRSTILDLDDPDDNARCHELAGEADVVIDSFRSRKMASFGFSPDELAQHRPGIIVLTIRCYGWDGPWKDRGGFDMLGSAASGLAMADGIDGRPALPATGMLNDYITGYLGAAGVQAALLRRAREGGSYHVSVSLTRTAMWALSLGLVPASERLAENPLRLLAMRASEASLTSAAATDIAKQIMRTRTEARLSAPRTIAGRTPLGSLVRLAPAVAYSATPASWRTPLLVPRGSSSPHWE